MKTILHYKEFWELVEQTPSCWNWKGKKNNSGYGYFRRREAHRLAYEIFEGPIPQGLDIDHLCRNRLCVNPAHLQPVTRKENLRRGIGFIAKKSNQTHCIRGHEFSIRTYKSRPKGRRWCRICHNDLQNKRKKLRKIRSIQVMT